MKPAIEAASIGIPDTLFLMLLALVVFGPRRLPEIGRQIGKLMFEFRKVSNDFKFQMEEELRASEEAERQRKLELTAPPAPAIQPLPELEAGHTPPPAPEFAAAGTDFVAPSDPETLPVAAEPAYHNDPEPSESFAESIANHDSAAAERTTESRGEPRRFPPIQPPSAGEVVPAAKPFRGRPETLNSETASVTQDLENGSQDRAKPEAEAHHA